MGFRKTDVRSHSQHCKPPVREGANPRALRVDGAALAAVPWQTIRESKAMGPKR